MRLGRLVEVVEVLHQREAGTHREAEQRGVDQEAHPVAAEQEHQRPGLQRLLQYRRAIPRVVVEIQRQDVDREAVAEIADYRQQGPHHEGPAEQVRTEQAMRIHVQQHAQQHERGQQRNQRLEDEIQDHGRIVVSQPPAGRRCPF